MDYNPLKNTMAVINADITVDTNNSLDGALKIVQLVKPTWKVKDISFKVLLDYALLAKSDCLSL